MHFQNSRELGLLGASISLKVQDLFPVGMWHSQQWVFLLMLLSHRDIQPALAELLLCALFWATLERASQLRVKVPALTVKGLQTLSRLASKSTAFHSGFPEWVLSL